MSGLGHCGNPFDHAEHTWQDGPNPDEIFRCSGRPEESDEDDYERANDE